jgi:hypothetical protein
VSIETDFETFWRAYPRRVGKLKAQREWQRLRPPLAEALSALEWQRGQWDDPKYVPHPATWLHQGRWMDEPAERMAVSATAAKVLKIVGRS